MSKWPKSNDTSQELTKEVMSTWRDYCVVQDQIVLVSTVCTDWSSVLKLFVKYLHRVSVLMLWHCASTVCECWVKPYFLSQVWLCHRNQITVPNCHRRSTLNWFFLYCNSNTTIFFLFHVIIIYYFLNRIIFWSYICNIYANRNYTHNITVCRYVNE